MKRILSTVFVLYSTQLAFAAIGTASPEFVTDPAMCGMDIGQSQEMGMRLYEDSMWTIEYSCEWDEPITFTPSSPQIRPGYCAEPGYIYPTVFVFAVEPLEGEAVYVFEGDSGEPTTFYRCEAM